LHPGSIRSQEGALRKGEGKGKGFVTAGACAEDMH